MQEENDIIQNNFKKLYVLDFLRNHHLLFSEKNFKQEACRVGQPNFAQRFDAFG